MDGWVKIHRKLLEWEWYQDGNMLRLFLHMLLRANREPSKWQGIDIFSGQFVSGRKKLSAETGISEKSIRTCLERFKRTSEVAIKSYNKFSVFTVINWNSYQYDESKGQQKGQQGSQRKGQQVATNKKEKNKEDLIVQKVVTEVVESSCYSFEDFWKAYEKKVGRQKSEMKYEKISEKERSLIKLKIEDYVKSTPNPKYRKNPLTWLNGKHWEDDIIQSQPVFQQNTFSPVQENYLD